MNTPHRLIAIGALAVVATGAAVASPAGASSSHSASIVHAATASVNGRSETILVNRSGLPLYIYRPDTTTRSLVSGPLAAVWPPLVTSKASATPSSNRISVLATGNGHQVAYKGHFLYTFADDSPGQVTGQGIQNFFIATPGMSALGHSAPATPRGTAPMNNEAGLY